MPCEPERCPNNKRSMHVCFDAFSFALQIRRGERHCKDGMGWGKILKPVCACVASRKKARTIEGYLDMKEEEKVARE